MFPTIRVILKDQDDEDVTLTPNTFSQFCMGIDINNLYTTDILNTSLAKCDGLVGFSVYTATIPLH